MRFWSIGLCPLRSHTAHPCKLPPFGDNSKVRGLTPHFATAGTAGLLSIAKNPIDNIINHHLFDNICGAATFDVEGVCYRADDRLFDNIPIAYRSLTGGAGNHWQRRYKFYKTKTAIISGRSTHNATAQETGSQGLFGNIYG